MHLNSKEGGEATGVCMGEFGGVDGITAILGVWEWRREPLPALSQLWGSYTAAEMPRSFSNHTSPRDVLMVVVDSRIFVKDSARLSLRGVHGVATGVDFKWLVLLQAGAGAELRLKENGVWLFIRKTMGIFVGISGPAFLQSAQRGLG